MSPARYSLKAWTTLAHAAGRDAGNATKKAAGRQHWNEADYNEAARVRDEMIRRHPDFEKKTDCILDKVIGCPTALVVGPFWEILTLGDWVLAIACLIAALIAIGKFIEYTEGVDKD